MTSERPEMRASDAERERVAEALRTAVAEGRLDMEEFGERLDAAYKARTHADLAPLVRDLPAAGTELAVPASAAPAATDGSWGGRIGGTPSSKGAVAVMGGFQRHGRWTVPRLFTAFTFWGGGQIDLREAHFEGREVTIRCIAVMGGVEVVVPPDLDVEVNGLGLMGGFDSKGTGTGSPGSPRVRITGFAFWGGVGVTRKERGDKRSRMSLEKGN
ncbi:DUF1707 SHOCT-like domain-containing protein [Streptomyces mobaraensis]|uniref:DUF1707 domain-containing protein n=1 Tax=Streptomyces mobaraensis TaxID=35621 RepID=A0A5N5WCK8_STRMB|nr:DUF1707 domain-containing protein [Streptomyces mobaraensis]KAB7849904.1 DUF1707 domain-containing protein [Streptomyces mobaraensis]